MIAQWMLAAVALGTLIALGGTFLSHLSLRFGLPRRWLWLALMLTSVALPVGMALRPPRIEAKLASHPEPQATDLQSLCCTIPGPSSRTAAEVPSRGGDDPLIIAWGVASFLLAGAFTLSHRRMRAELSGCPRRRIDGATVAVSPDFGPAAVGLLRSEVILPEWVFELPHDEQQLVLRHELEHIRAGDQLVLLAGISLAVLMPWNLGLWWQLRRLRVGIEVDCDARVAPTPRDRPRYAELLLRARHRHCANRLALALAPAPSALGERLMALLESATLSPRQALMWGMSAAACGMMIARVPIPNLEPLLEGSRSAISALDSGAPFPEATPPQTANGTVAVAPTHRPTRSTVNTPRGRTRYDSLIPIPVIGAPGHPRYDSLVPYVPGPPTMARGTYVGPAKAVPVGAPDSIHDRRE